MGKNNYEKSSSYFIMKINSMKHFIKTGRTDNLTVIESKEDALKDFSQYNIKNQIRDHTEIGWVCILVKRYKEWRSLSVNQLDKSVQRKKKKLLVAGIYREWKFRSNQIMN